MNISSIYITHLTKKHDMSIKEKLGIEETIDSCVYYNINVCCFYKSLPNVFVMFVLTSAVEKNVIPTQHN